MDFQDGIFNYDLDRVRDRMAKFVIQEALPFSHFDNPRLTNMIRETLQPRYTQVSRQTLRRYCLKMWKNAKQELVAYFENLNTEVNLTSDVWSAPHNLPESYLCVTAHWVEPSSWIMMKRTIAFELFPVLSLRRTKLTPESVEMCICLKDHLDSIDRIQDQTTLEDETSIEVKVHDEEVEEGLSPGLSDEELAFEANFGRSQQNDTNL
ncbi:hypothetical protein E3N88_15858 [Mikania micrantha]|uniref:HAT C-terminal dimerisation domain-containing protein n=1 Tax=Mikania micrantha TaxID=192012 RepID=A0A5N6NY14_9ASTR|nr:hypothetical protein E3N88_15858 [Mikania micrantha]